MSLLQVHANAPSGITADNFKSVLETILEIGKEYSSREQTDELKTILNDLSKELEKLNKDSEMNQIQLFSDKLEVLKDAPTRLWGFSTLSNAEEGFYNEQNEQIASGSVCLFRSDRVGKHTITFKAINTKTTLTKNITISVIANKLKERIN